MRNELPCEARATLVILKLQVTRKYLVKLFIVEGYIQRKVNLYNVGSLRRFRNQKPEYFHIR